MNLIGLPSLPKLPSGKGIFTNLLSFGQGKLWQLLTLEPTWGIYMAGSSTELAVAVDSVIEVSLNEESDVPDYRLQTGSFASYNKISQPTEIPLVISKSGSIEEREVFLSWLKEAVRNPTVFDIMMPEKSYQSLTLQGYTTDRTQDGGMDLIVAKCKFLEIREAPEQYYDAQQGQASTANTTDPDGKPTAVEKKVEVKVAGTVGERVQDIFSLERVSAVYTNIKTTASSIVSSIESTASSYYQKVKGLFS